jgi:hypothetical protein
MVDDVDWEKLLFRPPERSLAILPAEQSSSTFGEFGRKKLCILSIKYFFHTYKVLYMPQNLTTWGLRLYFPSE